MSYSSNYVLNERVSYLEWEVNNLNPPPGGYTLSTILAQGNSAGAYDINLNNNDLLNADAVSATTLNVAGAINLQNTGNQIYNDSTNNTIITIPTGKSVNIQSPAGSTQLAVSSTGATASTPFQFNGNVSVGSTSTTNLTPVINTYKSQLLLGNGGNGSIDVECPMNVGGFGSLTMTASNITLNSGGRINQGVLTTTNNVLATTEVLSSYGASATSTLYVQDSSGAQGINFIPNASGGAYNPLIGGSDCEIVVKGSATNTKNLSITTWASANTGVKITPTSTTIGAGGTSTAPTTGTTYDGSNITMTSPNPPLSTATQPATSDNSNKMPTTAWVQSLFATIPTPVSVMPYFRFSATTNVNSNRYGTPFGFQFNGASGWTTQDFFTIRMSVSSVTWGTTPINFNLSCIIDIYPALCPANTAYGSTSNNPTTVSSSPFVNLNGNIYSGTQYYSSFPVPIDATYNPLGRWFYPSSYNLTNNLGIAQQPNCLPLYPYITNTTQQTNFGFQLWAVSTITFPTTFSVNCEIIGNTTTQPVTSYGVTQFSNYYKTF